MNHIKIFEAFTEEHYKKILLGIKDLLNKDTEKDDIIKYIDNSTNDDKKNINELRITINRLVREFNKNSHYHFYNRRTETTIKKRAGKSKDGEDNPESWLAGQAVSRRKYDYKRYYMFTRENLSEAENIFSYNKERYEELSNSISGFTDMRRLKYFCDRLFKILEWCLETGIEKNIISNSHRDNLSDDQKFQKIEDLNDDNFENEYDEVNLLLRRINNEITTLF